MDVYHILLVWTKTTPNDNLKENRLPNRKESVMNKKRFLTDELYRNSNARKRYVQELPGNIEWISRFSPKIAGLRNYLLPLITESGVRVTPKQFKKLITSLLKMDIPISVEVIEKLMCVEIHRNGLKNFRISTFIQWLDILAEKRCFHAIQRCIEKFNQKQIRIPEEKIVAWGWNAIQRFQFRTGGMIVLMGKCAESPLLDTKQIFSYALESAEMNADHGITRMFQILLIRLAPKKHGRLSFKRAKLLAEVICHVFTERKGSDQEFTPEFLIRMAAGFLSEKGFEMMLSLYLKMMEEREEERQIVTEKSLNKVRKHFETLRFERYLKIHKKPAP